MSYVDMVFYQVLIKFRMKHCRKCEFFLIDVEVYRTLTNILGVYMMSKVSKVCVFYSMKISFFTSPFSKATTTYLCFQK